MRFFWLLAFAGAHGCFALEPPPLVGCEALSPTADRSAEMVAGIGKWLEHETARVATDRATEWRREAASPHWAAFAESKRALHRQRLGMVEARIPSHFDEVRALSSAGLSEGKTDAAPNFLHV